MVRTTAACALALLLTALGGALANDFEDYPQFRYSSGLPGGGISVDFDGAVGFSGAMQMAIPVGYTPSAGNYTLGAFSGAVNGGLEVSFEGEDANGTVTLGVGFGKPEHGLWMGNMMTGKTNSGEPSLNFQMQVLPETESHPGVSFGVLDLFNMRSQTLSRLQDRGARSLFVAATRQAGSAEHPLYYTVGLGTRRYNGFFGGVSYQASDRLKLMAEYDGWGINAATAYDLWRQGQEWHGVLFLGAADLEKWTVGATLSRTPAP